MFSWVNCFVAHFIEVRPRQAKTVTILWKLPPPLKIFTNISLCYFLKIKNCFGILKLSGRWQANKDKCYSHGLVGWAVGSLPATENDDWNKYLFKFSFDILLAHSCFVVLVSTPNQDINYRYLYPFNFGGWEISRLPSNFKFYLLASQ